jgi:carbon storage regulator
MLALSRKTGERIRIGPDIWVTVVRTGNESIRLGVDAPEGVKILRGELTEIEQKPIINRAISGTESGTEDTARS